MIILCHCDPIYIIPFPKKKNLAGKNMQGSGHKNKGALHGGQGFGLPLEGEVFLLNGLSTKLHVLNIEIRNKFECSNALNNQDGFQFQISNSGVPA